MTVSHSGDPEDLVADFQPRTIHGELTDGTAVSIVDAQGGSTYFGFFDSPLDTRQKFGVGAGHVVVGEFVTAEQVFYAIRFQVLGPTWFGADEDQARTADGSRLRMYWDDESIRWFEFIGANPMPLHTLDTGVLNAVTTLARLATRNDATAASIRVKLGPESPWREVYRARGTVDTGIARLLLDTTHLTAARFARWIDFRKHSDGLDAAALDELEGAAVQTHVLALAAIAEGLHRRLFGEAKRRVKGLSNNKIGKMRRAARDAALPLLTDPPFTDDDRSEFDNAIRDAFGHINDQTFRSRMADLLDDARRSIPEIGSAFADWPDAVSTARDLLAHQPPMDGETSTGEFRDLLIALSYSIAWVLRTNLLNKAGFDAQTLQEAYRYSSAYGHHLANTRTLLATGPYATLTGINSSDDR
jgi:hypothetical protein